MSATRNNHYVPIWYQQGFLPQGQGQLAYRDMKPEMHSSPSGISRPGKSNFKSYPSQCFVQRDLYTTFFGVHPNDEIERKLFGAVDSEGASAIRAFAAKDTSTWHEHFQNLFLYIDVQKIRTPKGLDWLQSRYPKLTQNDLMQEMQEIRSMHCSIWSEGVREIVSAKESDVKFIISDHPVTIYNRAFPPGSDECQYPMDPSIALKGSQTIYVLDQDHCLILTNLEYAKNPDVVSTEKRTFARNYRNSMVRTDAFVRKRQLTGSEVCQINHIIKARARRYIAAGNEAWLDPESGKGTTWSALGEVLRPPKDELFHFGGELYAKFDNGDVHYQDEFGRTEKAVGWLKKELPTKELVSADACGCGSGKSYGLCCKKIPEHLRASWTTLSIRERNLTFGRGMLNILKLGEARDWAEVRRSLTKDQIKDVHLLYQALWPIETDMLSLLPKPDGRPRSVYTGSLHPHAITDFALGATLYFGEILIENPFVHPAHMRAEFSPIENPHSHHQNFIKNVYFFLMMLPLIEAGFVNLIPDPTDFDLHLKRQMLNMARKRSANMHISPEGEPRIKLLMEEDMRRDMMSMPSEFLARKLCESSPDINENNVAKVLDHIRLQQERDPLAALQDNIFGGSEQGGQLNMSKMGPNFEMALYIAQATGASIITDSPYRWKEIQMAVSRQGGGAPYQLPRFAGALKGETFNFPNSIEDFTAMDETRSFQSYAPLFADIFNYLIKRDKQSAKPNWESQLPSRLYRIHKTAQKQMKHHGSAFKSATLQGIFPNGGIHDNTVNRLLLMSSAEHHLYSVPMAFFVEPTGPL